jgi:hypothetical protein
VNVHTIGISSIYLQPLYLKARAWVIGMTVLLSQKKSGIYGGTNGEERWKGEWKVNLHTIAISSIYLQPLYLKAVAWVIGMTFLLSPQNKSGIYGGINGAKKWKG